MDVQAPFQVLHYQAQPAFMLLDPMQRTNARMIERGQCSRPTAKPLKQRQVAGQLFRKRLQDHGPARDEVLESVVFWGYLRNLRRVLHLSSKARGYQQPGHCEKGESDEWRDK